jgi:NmrA-like family protein
MSTTAGDKQLIAVTGATGRQGGAVVRALQGRGQFRVRALTRNPEKHHDMADEVVEADLDRPETLRRTRTPGSGKQCEYLPLVGDFMSFNEIVDTLNRQGHTFTFNQVPPEVFATLFPGAAEIAETFKYFQAHTYLGSDWSDRIALANKIAGGNRPRWRNGPGRTFRCRHFKASARVDLRPGGRYVCLHRVSAITVSCGPVPSRAGISGAAVSDHQSTNSN